MTHCLIFKVCEHILSIQMCMCVSSLMQFGYNSIFRLYSICRFLNEFILCVNVKITFSAKERKGKKEV